MPIPVPPSQTPALLAGIFNRPAPAHVGTCPDAPAATFTASAAVCPALEVTGKVDATGATLDPAFNLLVPSAELARTVREPNATLSGYTSNGELVFTQSFAADGPFHVDVPLGPARAQLVHRLKLATGSATTERSATAHGEPSAETVATGDREILFAWDARAFPAIRVTADNDPTSTSYLNGSSTFEQATLGMSARRLIVDFSDGVRSVARRFAVLGR